MSCQRYCSTANSRSGFSHMWSLKNSKELLENLKSHDFSKIERINRYDLSKLYTTILHNKLKSRLFQIINHYSKNGILQYFWWLGNKTYFVRHHFDSPYKYSETDIKGIHDSPVDNVYVVYGDLIFQQSAGIPICTNCAPVLQTYSYIHMRQILFRNCHKIITKTQPCPSTIHLYNPYTWFGHWL
jgi:hypothetical protein